MAAIDEIQKDVSEFLPSPAEGSILHELESLTTCETISLYRCMQFSLHQAMGDLVSIRTLLIKEDIKYVPALESLLRTAMLGDARPTWILIADKHDLRLSRARQLLLTELRNAKMAADNSTKFREMELAKAPVEFVDLITEDYRRMQGLANKISETTMLREFANEMNALTEQEAGLVNPNLDDATTWLWNTGSAASHAYGWTQLVGASNADSSGHYVANFGIIVPYVQAAIGIFLNASAKQDGWK
ncbi:hypothetical protein [Corynebacterium silvaticum]|uniref:Uncharacterized protein n=1 Tax=Corynebacterium silvaticum TaxID=2320431 RepID=A0A7U5HLS4_9CORY|nr:hypothetical protein [Corynebacterium silvaticum]ARU46109.2 hypothetical protein CBE74_05970 [Corynebacterium silvaticum]MBH5299215.1 hypothetical protein [Corynebacterium silvaticum]NOM64464.1 hypothetical protein [Corynebacterium silvaticum]NON71142.1 hypothetical protein [Corynebacterium silvaticum]TFA91435.1 hypothetical protein EU802_11370 [Corynebacterium silvaticum]